MRPLLCWLLAPLLLLAACGGGGSGGGLYVALGDSLTEGVGATDPASRSFVALVHSALGDDVELLNLGHAGDTSGDLINHGHLDEAVSALELAGQRQERRLVTITIGGNDLLNLYFQFVITGRCPTLESLAQRSECRSSLSEARQRLEANLDTILGRLRQAAPDAIIVVATLYDPFGERLDPGTRALVQMALEGGPGSPIGDGINDILRAKAQAHGARVADLYQAFQGRSGLISGDLIHPNDQGYRVIADTVLPLLESR
jgi:lysophospholipase L1-like esterase